MVSPRPQEEHEEREASAAAEKQRHEDVLAHSDHSHYKCPSGIGQSGMAGEIYGGIKNAAADHNSKQQVLNRFQLHRDASRPDLSYWIAIPSITPGRAAMGSAVSRGTARDSFIQSFARPTAAAPKQRTGEYSNVVLRRLLLFRTACI